MSRSAVARRLRFAIGVVLGLVGAGLALTAAPAAAVSNGLVISQVYGGGGNASATFTHDFIELYNRGTTPVDLDGFSLQYASATGTGNLGANTGQLTELPAAQVPPGGYVLVQEASTAAVGAPLPPALVEDPTPIAMAAGGGKVALVTGDAGLGCNGSAGQPCDSAQLARIVDFVGYGTANFFEGSGPAPMTTTPPSPANTIAALRINGGATDTDNNAADFVAVSPPTPRNTVNPPDAEPDVAASVPTSGTGGVAANANVTIEFSEPVAVAGAWFSITCSTTGAHTAAVGGGPQSFVLDPDVDFASPEACTVTVIGARVNDLDTNDPPDEMAADRTFRFATAGTVEINDVQGASHDSPFIGTAVAGVAGVVTARLGNGFYFQDPTPDADPATSDAIFVFTNSPPAVTVGDSITVNGSVAEFRPGGVDTANLTTTELTSPVITPVPSGNPLPLPTVIGAGGRTPPTTVIDDDSFGSFDPASDGIDFYESLEAMRVQVNDAVAVGPRNDFGEIPVVGDNGAGAGVRTPRGGVIVRPGDFNPERIHLDDVIMPTPVANVGDGFNEDVVGVIDYSFGNFKLNITAPLTADDNGLVREATARQDDNELSVATFNVENLHPGDPAAKFTQLATIIVNNLAAPDVVALEEVQDNNGPTNNGVTAADQTLNRLVAAIAAASGGTVTYDYRQIDPQNNQDGGQPGGNIRVAFLFRTDRGVTFVDRAGGTSTAGTGVVAGADGPELTFSPGRVDPGNTAWTASRKPLAGEFDFRGEKFFVIANHFNSKGGDDPLFGRFQPPVLNTEVQRLQQATVLGDFVESILAIDPSANVIALGDFNDFEFSPPLGVLKASGLVDLIERLPENERYTYVFEGNSQTLDHILMSGAADGMATDFDVVHLNAEFADQASDHDPSIARLVTNEAPDVDPGGPYQVDEGDSVTLSATAGDPEGDAVTFAWDLDGNGTFETPGESVTFSAVAIDGPSVQTVRVRATDAFGSTDVAEATVTVVNVAPTATFDAPDSSLAGFPFTLSLTGPADPSAADTEAGFTYAFDCGGGFGPFTTSSTATCTPSDVGSLGVGARIRDKDGDFTEYRDTVTVEVTFDSLCDLTRAYSSEPGIAQALCAILDAAERLPNPVLREIKLSVYRALVMNNTGTRSVDAFTPVEGATLVRLSRAL